MNWKIAGPARDAPSNVTSIVLAVINARYSHAALGPRCLLANMGDLHDQTVLEEFVIQDHPQRMAERILAHRPGIVGISLSIWNVQQGARVINLIKAISPGTCIIIGGPEVRWAAEPLPGADILIRGEAELTFPETCRRVLSGENPPAVIDAVPPDLQTVNLPYNEYSDEDLRQRIIYVEASRGCPFGCEFCLSSRDTAVRKFDLENLLQSLDRLIQKGCRSFKFIDRTFNLELTTCRRLLDFFFQRWPRDEEGAPVQPLKSRQVGLGSDRGESLFLHFEVVPDRFDEALIESLSRFPDGGIQLEMGVQTLDPEIGERIGRRVDAEATLANITRLRERTRVHIHADLIMGLPGEDVNGIAASFDALRNMGPHEIQVGVLKLLPGAPIARHTDSFGMVYNSEPPYDILQTDQIDFHRMQSLKSLARYYDIFANSGKFAESMNRIMDSAGSAFGEFDRFSLWVWRKTGRDHAISQAVQYELVLEYLTIELNMEYRKAGKMLSEDYLTLGKERYMPEILRPYHGAPRA